MDTADKIESLSRPGLITERQAEAWILVDIEGIDRTQASDQMECSLSNVDALRQRAQQKIEAAQHTAALAHSLQSGAIQ